MAKTSTVVTHQEETKELPSKFAAALAANNTDSNVKTKKSKTTLAAEELILLHREMDKYGVWTMMEHYENLKKQLSSHIKESNAAEAEEYTFKTDLGTITYSACRKTTVVTDKAAMVTALGDELFATLASVGVSDLKKYLSEADLQKCTELEYGSRSLKAVVPVQSE